MNQSFHGLGIAPSLLGILTKLNFTKPTPIQQQSMPVALAGKDIIGIAQTGTGKTLAFGIPMIQRLATDKGQGLIIVPTRELALQVEESLKRVGRSLNLRTASLIGGANMAKQVQEIRRHPHVIIATPGRLNDHLEQKTLNLSQVKILVLDEADRMLDMGFKPQIEKALRTVPRDRQTMLFSASMPSEIIHIANAYMKSPVQVEVAPSGTTAETVSQEIFFVSKEGKLPLLQILLAEHKGSVLIFSRTKHGAKKIANAIRHMGHSSTEIHSNKTLNQRLEALSGFKTGKYRILVATDIAARGIDVKNIELVINFDLPDSPEDYVHRIGRTGRAKEVGHAISFATPDQKRDLVTIERLIKKQVPISQLPQELADYSHVNKPVVKHQNFNSKTPSNSHSRSRDNRNQKPNKINKRQEAGREAKFKSKPWDDRLISGPKKFKSGRASVIEKKSTKPKAFNDDLDRFFADDLSVDRPPQRSHGKSRFDRARNNKAKRQDSKEPKKNISTNLTRFRQESKPSYKRYR